MHRTSPAIRITFRTISRCQRPASRLRILPTWPRIQSFTVASPSQHIHTCSIKQFAPAAQFSTANTSFPDPSRSDLFYHFLDPPTPLSASLPAFALSFLPEAPNYAESPAVIGWLPAQIYEADSGKGDNLGLERQQDAGLNDFRENSKFTEVLHEAIKEALREKADDIWVNSAKQLQNGWMHIQDQRNIPALGRIGDPDDIIGSVLVEDSEILYDTYQPMPSYRICTADGVTQLTPGLHEKLTQTLLRMHEIDKATVNP